MYVLLKAVDSVKDFYTNHKSFYDGDCGLDLFCSEDVTIEPGETKPVSLGLQVAAYKSKDDGVLGKPVGWLLYPRSSISKTPLRLANCVGVIDAQYRGDVILMLDNIKTFPYTVKRGDRLAQMVSYGGEGIKFELTDDLDVTERGDKGFGSTGR